MPRFQVDITHTEINRYFVKATDIKDAMFQVRLGRATYTNYGPRIVSGVHEVSDELVNSIKRYQAETIWHKEEVPFETDYFERSKTNIAWYSQLYPQLRKTR